MKRLSLKPATVHNSQEFLKRPLKVLTTKTPAEAEAAAEERKKFSNSQKQLMAQPLKQSPLPESQARHSSGRPWMGNGKKGSNNFSTALEAEFKPKPPLFTQESSVKLRAENVRQGVKVIYRES